MLASKVFSLQLVKWWLYFFKNSHANGKTIRHVHTIEFCHICGQLKNVQNALQNCDLFPKNRRHKSRVHWTISWSWLWCLTFFKFFWYGKIVHDAQFTNISNSSSALPQNFMTIHNHFTKATGKIALVLCNFLKLQQCCLLLMKPLAIKDCFKTFHMNNVFCNQIKIAEWIANYERFAISWCLFIMCLQHSLGNTTSGFSTAAFDVPEPINSWAFDMMWMADFVSASILCAFPKISSSQHNKHIELDCASDNCDETTLLTLLWGTKRWSFLMWHARLHDNQALQHHQENQRTANALLPLLLQGSVQRQRPKYFWYNSSAQKLPLKA